MSFDRLVIECTGMADPGPITDLFLGGILCQRYLLDGVIPLRRRGPCRRAVNQFTIAQSQVGYANRILLTKTDVASASRTARAPDAH
ncbi:GTP-binding protein [Shigella flexneri]